MTPTQTTVIAQFEITGWDETTYDQPERGPKLTRATVRKTFSGALAGASTAELLTAQGDNGSGYLASERIDGVLDGRRGTFVIQHGGLADGGDSRTFGSVVPGSGTDDLTRLRGEAVYAHDETGARLTLTYSFSQTA